MGPGGCLRRLCAGCLLRGRTYRNTRPYVPEIRCGKVVRVYDGDTVHLVFRRPGAWRSAARLRVRLAGLDCAEVRAADPDERWVALRSKRLLEGRVLGRIVTVVPPLRWDKYGRLLVDLAVPGVPSISAWMIRHGDGVPYDGGTKAAVDWGARRRRQEDTIATPPGRRWYGFWHSTSKRSR